MACVVSVALIVMIIGALPYDNFQHIDHTANGALQFWGLGLVVILATVAIVPAVAHRGRWCSLGWYATLIIVFGVAGLWLGAIARNAWSAECGDAPYLPQNSPHGCVEYPHAVNWFARYWLACGLLLGSTLALFAALLSRRARRPQRTTESS